MGPLKSYTMNKTIIILACIVIIFQIIMLNENLAKRDMRDLYTHSVCVDEYKLEGAVDFERFMKECMSK
jgi:hypothetical protein